MTLQGWVRTMTGLAQQTVGQRGPKRSLDLSLERQRRSEAPRAWGRSPRRRKAARLSLVHDVYNFLA